MYATRHIQAFAQALQTEDYDLNDDVQSVSNAPLSPVPRVRKISALSDFAPVNIKVKRYAAHYFASGTILRYYRRRKPSHTPHKQREWLYVIMRWPLLVFCCLIQAWLHNVLSFIQGLLFLFIAVQFGGYVLLRQIVNVKEWISACRCSSITQVATRLRGSRAGTQRSAEAAIAECADIPGVLD